MHTQEYRYKEDPETSGSILVQQVLNAFEALMSRSKQSLSGPIHYSVGEYHKAEDILQQRMFQLSLSLNASKLRRRRIHAKYTDARFLSYNDVLANRGPWDHW
jgi:hypothetical protein